MVTLTRSLMRTFRLFVRKSVLHKCARASPAAVLLESGTDGLRLQCVQAGLGLSYHLPGAFPAMKQIVPLAAFEACASTCETPVAISSLHDGMLRLVWQQGRLPCEKRFDPIAVEAWPDFPMPDDLQDAPDNLIDALAHAMRSAAQEAHRYALDHLLLDGDASTLAATDGRELLIQQRIAVPWKGQVLIPKLPIYGCKEFATAGQVRVGKTGSHLVLEVGPWILHLPIPRDVRFPPVTEVVPKADHIKTVLTVAPPDAAFLREILPQLPGADVEYAPVTLELGTEGVIVRAQEPGQSGITEVVLTGSHFTGNPVLLVIPRGHLLRALTLGLTEFHIEAADKAVLAQDATRQFVAMPLDKKSALHSQFDALRISSSAAANKPSPRKPIRAVRSVSSTPIDARVTTMPAHANGAYNGSHNGYSAKTTETPAKSSGYAAVLAEAQALQALFREGLAKSQQLIANLKQHRRQAKAVQTSLLALRELQAVDA